MRLGNELFRKLIQLAETYYRWMIYELEPDNIQTCSTNQLVPSKSKSYNDRPYRLWIGKV